MNLLLKDVIKQNNTYRMKSYNGTDVNINEKTYEEFIKINEGNIVNNKLLDSGLFPYQSIDMRKSNDARFAKKEDFDLYKISNDDFEKKMKDILNEFHKNKRENKNGYIKGNLPLIGRNFNLTSDIEIHKMKRANEKYNYKYLIQLDEKNITNHTKDILHVIDKLDINDAHYTFIPYIKKNRIVDNFNLKEHNTYNKINIVNNEQFIVHLKEKITKKENLEKLLHYLNTIFYYYDDMLNSLSDYYGSDVTNENIIDIIIKIQHKLIWGLNENNIVKRLNERNEVLEKYSNINVHNCNEQLLYDEYYSWLGNQNKIMDNKEMIENIRNCNAVKIEPNDFIIDDEITLKQCSNMIFSPADNYSKYTYSDFCKQIVATISNQKIRDNLIARSTRNITNSRCSHTYSTPLNTKHFNLFTACMPEWYNNIYNNNFVEAFKHRQLLIGDTTITAFFRNCSLLYKSDPFISKECELPGIIHDIEWNKVVISCIANSDDIFPIRIVNCKSIETMNIYENFKFNENNAVIDENNDNFNKDNDNLIGSLVIKLKGERTVINDKKGAENRYYFTHFYYNDKGRFPIRLVDFKNNIIIPGSIIEYVRALYIELNTLMFYEQDTTNKLYYYKLQHDTDFDVFVSKYSFETIKLKYNEMINNNKNNDPTYLTENYLDKLEEVRLLKDHNKIFKFIPVNMKAGNKIFKFNPINIQGGNKTGYHTDDYIFNFRCASKYEWDIQTSSKYANFEKDVFSITLYEKRTKLSYELSKLMGDAIFDIFCNPLDYLKTRTLYPIGNITTEQIQKMVTAQRDYATDSTGKIYKDDLKNLKKQNSILSYNFESSISIHIYHLFNQFITDYKNNDNNKCVIFSKNHLLLDGFLYYEKFKKLNNPPTIIFISYEVEGNVRQKTENYLKINKINKITVKEPMNNIFTNNLLNTNKINNINLSIIDIIIKIDEFKDINYLFLLQSQISPIIITLKNLNIGGIMILNMCLIPNKMIFNLMTYLSCFFEQTFIADFKDTDLHTPNVLICSFITFYKYKGNVSNEDIDKLLKLNEIMFKCDVTGGYNFNTEKQQQYVTNIITVDELSIEDKYAEYKEYCKMKLLGSIRNFNNRYDNFINENREYMQDKCNIAKLQAIYYAKKYDLPLLDWANEIPSAYFDKIITEKLKNIDYTSQNEIKCDTNKIKLDIYTKLKCDNCNTLIKNIEISETAYQYIEKINYDAYKNVELFMNSKYKKLNNNLLDDYDININGKSVNRAWIKFYELLVDTQILEKYKNDSKIDVFFMCEAPGNFVKSMMEYINRETKIRTFNWNAQSLAQSQADFFDSYGFIKQTINKWDQGPTKSGNILNSENQNYYFNKYGGKVDFLIGDCGEKWIPGEKNNNKDTSIYQLFYALLMPKVGGRFVIKTFSSNNNKLFLSLLYLICSKYEKVLAFKSNTNFWSPEIYIVGIGNKGLTNEEKQIIRKIINKTNNNETCFPIDHLPEEFIKNYGDIMYNYISFASDIKKFFVFLSTNEDIFKTNKENITNIINEKNNGWMKKYLGERTYNF